MRELEQARKGESTICAFIMKFFLLSDLFVLFDSTRPTGLVGVSQNHPQRKATAGRVELVEVAEEHDVEASEQRASLLHYRAQLLQCFVDMAEHPHAQHRHLVNDEEGHVPPFLLCFAACPARPLLVAAW